MGKKDQVKGKEKAVRKGMREMDNKGQGIDKRLGEGEGVRRGMGWKRNTKR